MRQKKNTAMQDIDIRHYSYLQAIYLSFFSPKLYIDVAKRWKNLSLKYLLLVFIIVCIPLSIRLLINFNEFFNQTLIYPFEKLPVFLIQNGQVKFDKPMPYLIKNKSGKVVAIIDTTGKVNTIDVHNPDLILLINKDKFSYRSPDIPSFFLETPNEEPRKTYEQAFETDTNQIFDGEKWVNSSHVHTMKYIMDGILYPTCIALICVLYLIIMLPLAMLVQVLSSTVFKTFITYQQGFRLLMVSATPHLAFLSLYLTVNRVFYGMKIALFILWAAYLAFSLISLKKSSRKMVRK